VIYLDTHVAVWLHQKRLDLFTPKGLDLMNTLECTIAPLVLLELEYLYEIGRLRFDSTSIYEDLVDTLELRLCPLPYAQVVKNALAMKWTQDPFDRMITAHAAIHQNQLLTRDRGILSNYSHAVW